MILNGVRYTYCIKTQLIKSFFDKREFEKFFLTMSLKYKPPFHCVCFALNNYKT